MSSDILELLLHHAYTRYRYITLKVLKWIPLFIAIKMLLQEQLIGGGEELACSIYFDSMIVDEYLASKFMSRCII